MYALDLLHYSSFDTGDKGQEQPDILIGDPSLFTLVLSLLPCLHSTFTIVPVQERAEGVQTFTVDDRGSPLNYCASAFRDSDLSLENSTTN